MRSARRIRVPAAALRPTSANSCRRLHSGNTTFSRPGERPLAAARQGSLDGLCGVYAVVNALEPAGVLLSRSMQRELFQQLTYSLGAAALLAAMHDGMDAFTLKRAAELAFGWLAARHRRRFRSTGGFLRALRPLVEGADTAVIIAFRGRGKAHWTVVREFDGADLLLRDSDGLTALRAKDFTVDEGRWLFWPADTLVIRQLGEEGIGPVADSPSFR